MKQSVYTENNSAAVLQCDMMGVLECMYIIMHSDNMWTINCLSVAKWRGEKLPKNLVENRNMLTMSLLLNVYLLMFIRLNTNLLSLSLSRIFVNVKKNYDTQYFSLWLWE